MNISSKSILKKTLLAQALCFCIDTSAYATDLLISDDRIINGNYTGDWITIEENGSLSGNAEYELTTGIYNDGRLSPGNNGIGTIDINVTNRILGNFYQSTTGNIELEFSGDTFDSLSINSRDVYIYGKITIKMLTNGAPITASDRTFRLSDFIHVTGGGVKEYHYTPIFDSCTNVYLSLTLIYKGFRLQLRFLVFYHLWRIFNFFQNFFQSVFHYNLSIKFL